MVSDDLSYEGSQISDDQNFINIQKNQFQRQLD